MDVKDLFGDNTKESIIKLLIKLRDKLQALSNDFHLWNDYFDLDFKDNNNLVIYPKDIMSYDEEIRELILKYQDNDQITLLSELEFMYKEIKTRFFPKKENLQ